MSSSVRSRYNDIPIHRRIKYNVLWVLAIVALITVTVVAIIDMNKTNEINTALLDFDQQPLGF